jgi:hypothetical protein
VVFGANVGAGSDEHLGHARVALACCHHERSLPAAKSAAASDGTQPSRSVHGPTRCCPRYGRRLQPRNVRRKRDPCAPADRSKRTGLDARHRRQVAAAPAAKVGHFAVRARIGPRTQRSTCSLGMSQDVAALSRHSFRMSLRRLFLGRNRSSSCSQGRPLRSESPEL